MVELDKTTQFLENTTEFAQNAEERDMSKYLTTTVLLVEAVKTFLLSYDAGTATDYSEKNKGPRND